MGKTFAKWLTTEIPLRQRFVFNLTAGFLFGLSVAAVHKNHAFLFSMPLAFAFLGWFWTFRWVPRSLSMFRTPRALLVVWLCITLGFFAFLFFAG
jgi:hypothetical protein